MRKSNDADTGIARTVSASAELAKVKMRICSLKILSRRIQMRVYGTGAERPAGQIIMTATAPVQHERDLLCKYSFSAQQRRVLVIGIVDVLPTARPPHGGKPRVVVHARQQQR